VCSQGPDQLEALLQLRLSLAEGAASERLFAGARQISHRPFGIVGACVVMGQFGQMVVERMLSDLQLGEFVYEQPAVGDT